MSTHPQLDLLLGREMSSSSPLPLVCVITFSTVRGRSSNSILGAVGALVFWSNEYLPHTCLTSYCAGSLHNLRRRMVSK